MSEKLLFECPEISPFDKSLNIDPPPPYCPDGDCSPTPSQQDVPFFQDITKTKKGLGKHALCDPMQTGQIVQDFAKDPNRNTIYRYSKAVRGADEAMMDLFNNIVVIDEQDVTHLVPIIWSSHERAVDFIIQENIRQDNSAVVDRVRLPIMSIYSASFEPDYNRYTYHAAINYFRGRDGKPGWTTKEHWERDTVFGVARGIPINIGYQLVAWTYFIEDMNQILEQIVTKFSRIAYIRVQGVYWETIVRLDSIASNLDLEPGNAQPRVIKFQFNMTAETYIPQPIRRDKAVLDTRIEFVDSINEDEITDIIGRLEVAIKK